MIMKKNKIILLFIITLIITTFALAQTNTNMGNSKNSKKFVYAYVYEKYNGTKSSFDGSGDAVSTATISKIVASKYSTQALDAMGAEGWELVSVTERNYQKGWAEEGISTTYYFKK